VATEGHFDQTFDVNVKGMFFTEQKGPPPLQRLRLDYPELSGFKGGGAPRLYRLLRE
jgi:hypothetical protein